MLDFSDDHIRNKRSSPNQRFKIHATNVDWRKMIGSPDVGASFGVVLKNTLDLKIGNSLLMIQKTKAISFCSYIIYHSTKPLHI